MTLKEEYALFIKDWDATHSISKTPSYASWRDYHRTPVSTLTTKLIAAGADREKVIKILDGYGDSVDWSHHSLDSIIAEVWQSDANSGEEPDGWIINEICRNFNIEEVTE